MIDEYVWINGEIISPEKAAISAKDQGLLFGYGLFETMRLYHSIPFMLDKHLSRLYASAMALEINIPDLNSIKNSILSFIDSIDLNDGVLRLTVTKGTCKSNIILTHRKIPYNPGDYERGFSLKVSSIKRNPDSPLTYHKTLNYLDNILARKEAEKEGFDEALLLNTNNHISECSSNNIFFIRKNILHTPRVNNGLLKGIVRDLILEQIADKAGYHVLEGDYTLEELYSSDEVFITNSVIQIMPVVKINANPISSGLPGTGTKKLTRIFENHAAACLNPRR